MWGTRPKQLHTATTKQRNTPNKCKNTFGHTWPKHPKHHLWPNAVKTQKHHFWPNTVKTLKQQFWPNTVKSLKHHFWPNAIWTMWSRKTDGQMLIFLAKCGLGQLRSGPTSSSRKCLWCSLSVPLVVPGFEVHILDTNVHLGRATGPSLRGNLAVQLGTTSPFPNFDGLKYVADRLQQAGSRVDWPQNRLLTHWWKQADTDWHKTEQHTTNLTETTQRLCGQERTSDASLLSQILEPRTLWKTLWHVSNGSVTEKAIANAWPRDPGRGPIWRRVVWRRAPVGSGPPTPNGGGREIDKRQRCDAWQWRDCEDHRARDVGIRTQTNAGGRWSRNGPRMLGRAPREWHILSARLAHVSDTWHATRHTATGNGPLGIEDMRPNSRQSLLCLALTFFVGLQLFSDVFVSLWVPAFLPGRPTCRPCFPLPLPKFRPGCSLGARWFVARIAPAGHSNCAFRPVAAGDRTMSPWRSPNAPNEWSVARSVATSPRETSPRERTWGENAVGPQLPGLHSWPQILAGRKNCEEVGVVKRVHPLSGEIRSVTTALKVVEEVQKEVQKIEDEWEEEEVEGNKSKRYSHHVMTHEMTRTSETWATMWCADHEDKNRTTGLCAHGITRASFTCWGSCAQCGRCCGSWWSRCHWCRARFPHVDAIISVEFFLSYALVVRLYSVIVNFLCSQIIAHFCNLQTGHLRCYLYTLSPLPHRLQQTAVNCKRSICNKINWSRESHLRRFSPKYYK